jgi:hypothetical protein
MLYEFTPAAADRSIAEPRGPYDFLLACERDTAGGDGCWPWLGPYRLGYGIFWTGTRNVRAHRWAFETFVRPLEPGEQVHHLCRYADCVRPTHLTAVTRQEHIRLNHAGHALGRDPLFHAGDIEICRLVDTEILERLDSRCHRDAL